MYAGEVSGFFETRWLSVGCGWVDFLPLYSPDPNRAEKTDGGSSRPSYLGAGDVPQLSKVRAELTNHQAQIVDTLKQQCPGFAEMRKLVLGFRTILRGGKLAALHCLDGAGTAAGRAAVR